MPLPMVHLCVAHCLIDKLNISVVPEFLLGSISPDAVHMRRDYKTEDKHTSHLRDDGKEMCEANAAAYAKAYAGVDIDGTAGEAGYFQKKIRDFRTGYGIHILTDRYWVRTVYSDFLDKYAADFSHVQEQKWAYYNDADNIDFMLYKNCAHREYIVKPL